VKSESLKACLLPDWVEDATSEARKTIQDRINTNASIRADDVHEHAHDIPNPEFDSDGITIPELTRTLIAEVNKTRQEQINLALQNDDRVNEWEVMLLTVNIFVSDSNYICFGMGVVRYIIALWLIFAGEGNHSSLMVFSLLILVPYTVVTDGFASVIKYGRILYITDDEIMSVFGWLIRFIHDCYLRIVKKIGGKSNDSINKNVDHDEECGVELTVTNPMFNIDKGMSNAVEECSDVGMLSVLNPLKMLSENLVDDELKSDQPLQSNISNVEIQSDVYSLPADSDSNEVLVEAISSTYFEKDIEAEDISMSMNPMLDNANIRRNLPSEESALSSDECLSQTFIEVKGDACLQAGESLSNNHTEPIAHRLSVQVRSSVSGGRGRLGLGRQGGRGGRGRGTVASLSQSSLLNKEGEDVLASEDVLSCNPTDAGIDSGGVQISRSLSSGSTLILNGRGGGRGGRGGRSSASFSSTSSINHDQTGGRSGRGGRSSASFSSTSSMNHDQTGGRSGRGGRSSASFSASSMNHDQMGGRSGRGGRSSASFSSTSSINHDQTGGRSGRGGRSSASFNSTSSMNHDQIGGRSGRGGRSSDDIRRDSTVSGSGGRGSSS